jgi:hypothetical protein
MYLKIGLKYVFDVNRKLHHFEAYLTIRYNFEFAYDWRSHKIHEEFSSKGKNLSILM